MWVYLRIQYKCSPTHIEIICSITSRLTNCFRLYSNLRLISCRLPCSTSKLVWWRWPRHRHPCVTAGATRHSCVTEADLRAVSGPADHLIGHCPSEFPFVVTLPTWTHRTTSSDRMTEKPVHRTNRSISSDPNHSSDLCVGSTFDTWSVQLLTKWCLFRIVW